MTMDLASALLGSLSALLTALFLWLGVRFTARQTRAVGEQQVQVEQRKVDQEAFDRFVTRYEADRQRQDAELDETRTLLGVALRYINLLRAEFRRRDPTVPPLPEQLQKVPLDWYDS